MSLQNNPVTVDFCQESKYSGPVVGSLKDKLRETRLCIAYRPYGDLLYRAIHPANQQEGLVLADVGCGPGTFLKFAQLWFHGSRTIGIDYDWRLVPEANRRSPHSYFSVGNAEQLPLDTSSVDILVSLHVVEHLYSPELLIQEALRVVKPGGLLMISTPNPIGLGAIIMRKRWTGWRSDHVSLHPPRYWIDLVCATGFSAVQQGTTGLSGIPQFRNTPLALMNYLALSISVTFPWQYGEAFVGLFRRN